jgi:hypothetical protein
MSVLKESIAVFADIRAKPGCESELRDTFSAASLSHVCLRDLS